jgi:hypothetical protein
VDTTTTSSAPSGEQFGFGYMHYDNTNLSFLSNGTNYHEQVGILNVWPIPTRSSPSPTSGLPATR